MDLSAVLDGLPDAVAEGLFAAGLLGGLVGMLWLGQRHRLAGQVGWRPMLAGMALLAAWGTVDFVDEFDEGLWVVAGADTEVLLEDLVMPLSGVTLLVVGILRWAPMHARLAAVETDAKRSEIARLQEMDRFKTTFLNTAAHELATPLTPIRLQVSLLRGRNGASSEFDVLDRNVGRMERLVHDLLDAPRVRLRRSGVVWLCVAVVAFFAAWWAVWTGEPVRVADPATSVGVTIRLTLVAVVLAAVAAVISSRGRIEKQPQDSG